MLAVQVDLLTDRYVATHFNDRGRAEWPPHPARLYSAMVATWADSDPPSDHERDALAWLAALGAPTVTASAADQRAPVTHYVPVNDAAAAKNMSTTYDRLRASDTTHVEALAAAGGDLGDRRVTRAATALAKVQRTAAEDSRQAAAAGAETAGTLASGLRVLPDRRGRQGRSYPCVVPETPRFFFAWPNATPTDHQRAVLDGLLGRVSRLGHSSSFVSCRLVDEAPPPTLVPHPAGHDAMLRVTAPGSLDRLVAAFEQHQGQKPRALPARMARYTAATPTAPAAPIPLQGGPWVVLARTAGPVLNVRHALPLARAVQKAIMSHADQPVPELISGHAAGPNGTVTPPSENPHMAVVPLPFVGAHGDGSVLGVAVVLPTQTSPDDRTSVLRALGRWRRDGFAVRLGRAGLIRLAVADAGDTRTSLDRRTWCRQSRHWLSVTPVALDRHPGDLWSARPDKREPAHEEARRSLATTCEYAGLPRPTDIQLSREPLIAGVGPAPAFHPYRGGRGPTRYLVHASLQFTEEVAGPVLLGAGRFLGYGLFRPTPPGGRRA